MFRKSLTNSFSAVAVLVVMVMLNGIVSAQTIDICHATSAGTYVLIQVSQSGANAHFTNNGTPQAGHELDFISTTGSCDAQPTPTPSPGAVPEPVTVLLFGTGVAGIGYLSRRYRKGRREKGSAE